MVNKIAKIANTTEKNHCNSMQNNQTNIPKMKKRNQRKKSAKENAEKVENVEQVPAEKLNIETEALQSKTCNVFEQEMSWRIMNFRIDKPYSVTFMLPRSIQCTVGLYPSVKAYNSDGFRRDPNYVHPHDNKVLLVKPIVFFNKIPNKRDHYKFKVKMQPAPGGNAREPFGISTYETATTRSDGFNCYGPLISSKNIRDILDRDGHLILDLTFTIKEMEHCKPFDREDYTIERFPVAKDMTKLFMSKKYSDVTIVLGDDKIPAHKVVLAGHSKTFAKMINENPANEIEITMRAPKEAYIEFIRFLYNSTIKDLKNNLESLLMLAKEFEVELLRKLCVMEIERAITIKYAKFIGKNPQVPNAVLDDEDKAMKCYKLIYSMDELFYEKKNDGPTPTSSKSSLEEEAPQSDPQTSIEASKEDIQLPTVILNPPPNIEPLPEMNEEIFTSSLTDMFVKTLSPINEQEEPPFESSTADIVVEKVEVIYSADNSTCETKEINEEISGTADQTAVEIPAATAVENPSAEEISKESSDKCAEKDQDEIKEENPGNSSVDEKKNSTEVQIDKAGSQKNEENPETVTNDGCEPRTVHIHTVFVQHIPETPVEEKPALPENTTEVKVDTPKEEEKPDIKTSSGNDKTGNATEEEIKPVQVTIPLIVVEQVPETQVENPEASPVIAEESPKEA